MDHPAEAPGRCGIDSVEISRIQRLLDETPAQDLLRIFSPTELAEAGAGPGRAASLAARFAAKEACLKLFPRETALEQIGAADFSVARDNYGAPRVECSDDAAAVMGRHRIGSISLSLTHDRTSASAVALAQPMRIRPPLSGVLAYRLLPIRRGVILENLRRVYGEWVAEDEIVRLAQAHYGHLVRLMGEFLRFPWMSKARRAAMVRVENIEAITRAHERGRGVLVLTGHFGNWEVSTVAGIGNFPDLPCKFHFVRRPLKPQWLENLVTRRFRNAGFGVLAKRGALDELLERLGAGDIIVFPFDQHAGPRDGVRVDFFGHSAGTFRSLAVIALATGAPVVPASSWREPDGRHVLRFEEALPSVERDNPDEEIRLATRTYNAALERMILRHPEQWWWVHRRWKPWPEKRRRGLAGGPGGPSSAGG
jgi:KDO2-lipid IV(A) lauroyltransferase